MKKGHLEFEDTSWNGIRFNDNVDANQTETRNRSNYTDQGRPNGFLPENCRAMEVTYDALSWWLGSERES